MRQETYEPSAFKSETGLRTGLAGKS